ncbi:hypothetical protein HHK36_016674 [Tetracentron sinense]|uniref:Amino acid transporter transmembrane domain-containing protein n=1 Tax=Tetracentron sinense TaxID=13715 RepID=A0A834Z0W2_TETSI|nr:hypothetical protein HHK36_016674 [Tetracentron sinense]
MITTATQLERIREWGQGLPMAFDGFKAIFRQRRLLKQDHRAAWETEELSGQSIDIYSSVASPNIGLLGSPTLSRLGSSFFSSSLTRRHTPEILSSLDKPFLSTQQQQQRKPSIRKAGSDHKPSKVSHGLPLSGQCSYGQAVLNGMNVLCGVGILSTPYAAKEGGWGGLAILFTFGVLSFYTGILLRRCLDSEPGLQTYPDIGQAAFDNFIRGIVWNLSTFPDYYLYYNITKVTNLNFDLLQASCVEYIILESDNLSSLFPNAHLSVGGFELNSYHLFALMTTLAVLPTVWLRDISVLSYISGETCLVDQVGFQNKGSTLNLTTLPVAIGLYGFCYSGHAVFPNIYTSMAKPNQYPSVLITCFTICTFMYAGVALMGYKMFGKSTASQFTLNMPQNLVASKIAVWTTV